MPGLVDHEESGLQLMNWTQQYLGTQEGPEGGATFILFRRDVGSAQPELARPSAQVMP